MPRERRRAAARKVPIWPASPRPTKPAEMRASSTNRARRHAISRRFAAICSETVALGLSTWSRTVGPGDLVTGTNRPRYFSPSIVTVVTGRPAERPRGRPAGEGRGEWFAASHHHDLPAGEAVDSIGEGGRVGHRHRQEAPRASSHDEMEPCGGHRSTRARARQALTRGRPCSTPTRPDASRRRQRSASAGRPEAIARRSPVVGDPAQCGPRLHDLSR